MSSSFYSNGENFDRIFFTDTQLIDRYIGNRAFGTGANPTGALGDASTTSRLSFVDFAGLGSTWKQVSGGIPNSLGGFGAGVKTDGTLWTWGRNNEGQLGSGNTASRSSPVTVAGGGTDWAEVSCGPNMTAAIKMNGSLWTWGNNSSGQLGDGSTINKTSPVPISSTANNWSHVAVGGVSSSVAHVLAVAADGSLWAWGYNYSGQLGDGSTLAKSFPITVAGGGYDWAKVAAGSSCSAAIKNNGTLWTWGINQTTIASFPLPTGVLGDGSILPRSSPQTVAGGGTNWKQVSISSGSSSGMAAVKTDGTLWTWGLNSLFASGRLGDGSTLPRSSPGTVAGGGTNWKQVSCSYGHTVAVKLDGSVWTWGKNSQGELGNGSTSDRSSPGTIVGGIAEWVQVHASGYTSTNGTAFGNTLGVALFIGGG